MSASDELAGIIDDRWHGYGYNPQGAAEAILTSGYRKPRTIASAEELATLPYESVVRSDTGLVYEKYPDDESSEFDYWLRIGESRPQSAKRIYLPATVLYEPEAKS